MDIFSADLPEDAFHKVPAPIVKPSLDPAAAERIAEALAEARNPVLYAGGGVLSARASSELTAFAELLEIPVAHSLMARAACGKIIRCCSA